LAHEPQFAKQLTERDQKTLLLAALLHDIGHWPFCHAIEDLRLSEFPTHETVAQRLVCSAPLADVIEAQWGVAPEQVARLIASTRDAEGPNSVLRSLLSGPVDIDKM